MADSIRLCSMPGCEHKHYARTYCKKHWARWHSHGDPNIVQKSSPLTRVGKCSAPGCIEKIRNQGLCASHYRNLRAGKPLARRGGRPASLPGEEWRPIAETDGAYEVSSLGRVCSMTRIDRAGRQLAGRIMSQSRHPLGYGYVALVCADGKKRRRAVHRLVAEAFIGPRPEGLHICHNDGDPRNNTVDNLRYDTPSENMYDIVRHGRHHLANATHCKRGHAFAEFGMFEPNYNRRYCGECRRQRQRSRAVR